MFSLIHVTLYVKNFREDKTSFIQTLVSNLNITLSEEAIALEFSSNDIPRLQKVYLIFCYLELFFRRFIIEKYFYTFLRLHLPHFSDLFSPYEAIRVHPQYQKDVENMTNNNYKRAHMIVVEKNEETPSTVSYKGSPTYGVGGVGSGPQNMTFTEGTVHFPKHMVDTHLYAIHKLIFNNSNENPPY
jgi:hypothetical protein